MIKTKIKTKSKIKTKINTKIKIKTKIKTKLKIRSRQSKFRASTNESIWRLIFMQISRQSIKNINFNQNVSREINNFKHLTTKSIRSSQIHSFGA